MKLTIIIFLSALLSALYIKDAIAFPRKFKIYITNQLIRKSKNLLTRYSWLLFLGKRTYDDDCITVTDTVFETTTVDSTTTIVIIIIIFFILIDFEINFFNFPFFSAFLL